MLRIEQTHHIVAPIAKVWQALTDPTIIEAWGAGPAIMSEKAGAKFSLWGGDIHGRNIEVVKESLLIQEWTAWDETDGPSTLQFRLHQKGDVTIVELSQKNIPKKEFKELEASWKTDYMGPMKKYLEANNPKES